MKLNLTKIKNYSFVEIIHIIYKHKIPGILRCVLKRLFCKLPLQDIIMFESHDDFDMNAGTLYEFALKKGINEKYKIYWLVCHKCRRKLPFNVFAVPIHGISLRREYVNCTAKYIFYDDKKIRKMRDGQLCIYLGHATRAMKDCRGLVTQPPNIDFVISSSGNNNALMADVYGCDINKMAVTGMPVTDVLFRRWNELDRIMAGTEKQVKVIMWMPTFRKSASDKFRNDSDGSTETGLALFDSHEKYEELSRRLGESGIHMIIKFHPGQDMKQISVRGTESITLLSAADIRELGLDTYKLLTQTDALISDYSSISFDYLLVDRPMAYVLSDLKDYRLGFAVENYLDYMPGDYIYTEEDFYRFTDGVAGGRDSHRGARNRLKNYIHHYQDGNSCERVLKLAGLL